MLLPIGIAGVNGVLEATVVDGDVPLLLPIRMLTGLKAVVNLETVKLHLNEYGVEVEMHELPSGHVTVDVMNFQNGVFTMPMEVPGCCQGDFHLPESVDSGCGTNLMSTAAMAQTSATFFQFESHGRQLGHRRSWRRPCWSASRGSGHQEA